MGNAAKASYFCRRNVQFFQKTRLKKPQIFRDVSRWYSLSVFAQNYHFVGKNSKNQANGNLNGRRTGRFLEMIGIQKFCTISRRRRERYSN